MVKKADIAAYMKLSKVFFKYSVEVILHLVFWGVVYFFYTYFLGYGSNNTDYVNKFSAFLMPVTIGISYFFLYFLIPNYLLKQKHALFLLYSVYTFIISVFLIILSILYGLVFLIELNPDNTSPLTKTLPLIILGVYFVVLIVVSLGLIKHNYNSIVNNENLKNKILATQLRIKDQELRFLKMQIHPHFLFNSLNTIYGFALEKKEEAPEMILKLSNLLDYILYQIEKPQVLLMDEVNHLLDYISLEKMRFHDTLEVKTTIDISSNTIKIAPMLLIPFVENAFKHGDIIHGSLNVAVNIKTEGDMLFFSIENTSIKEDKNSNGIGLENIEKRLEMLFPNAYSLETTQTANYFRVKLTIRSLKQFKNE
ncbi:sensor histidine kinase [Lutibacter sp.]